MTAIRFTNWRNGGTDDVGFRQGRHSRDSGCIARSGQSASVRESVRNTCRGDWFGFAVGDVDAVYIANAPQQHAVTCVAALEAGKLFCAKSR
jgi:hypothetical protein